MSKRKMTSQEQRQLLDLIRRTIKMHESALENAATLVLKGAKASTLGKIRESLAQLRKREARLVQQIKDDALLN